MTGTAGRTGARGTTALAVRRIRAGLDGATVLRVAILDAGAFVLLLLVLEQRAQDTLVQVGPLALFAFGLVLGLLVRAAVAAVGTASYRSRRGLPARRDALPSVLAGTALGWLLVLLVSLPAGPAALAPLALLQCPRWLAESALGVIVVRPDLDA